MSSDSQDEKQGSDVGVVNLSERQGSSLHRTQVRKPVSHIAGGDYPGLLAVLIPRVRVDCRRVLSAPSFF